MSAGRSWTLAFALGWLLAGSVPAPMAHAQQGPGAQQDEALPAERLLEELRQRAAKLERREIELAERERALAELEAPVEARIAELERLRKEVETRISSWEAQDGDRIARLAKVYASMPPGRAAPLLERLELDLATGILSRMKHKSSAAVLAAMQDDRALRLSQRVARPLAPPAKAGKTGR